MASVYLPDRLANTIIKSSDKSLVEYVKIAVELKIKSDGYKIEVKQ